LIRGHKLLQIDVIRAAAAAGRRPYGVHIRLYQHPVLAHPSPQRSRLLYWGDGWEGTGCCEQTVLSKTGQTVKPVRLLV